MVSGEEGAAADRVHLAGLCRRFGVAEPPAGANHFFQDFGDFRMKWERHAEFCTYTFYRRGPFSDPFADPAVASVPTDWLENLPGSRLVAINAAFMKGQSNIQAPEELGTWFEPEFLAGSQPADGLAEVWTDFRIHKDGFGRVLVRDRGLRPRQAGRLAQRLLEIETYRMMALLALPLARVAGPRVTAVEQALADITESLARIQSLADEQSLLVRLATLAAELERFVAANGYRFGAAQAYFGLVERRIVELRERRTEGVQTIGEFMERRLVPAMRTCKAVAERQEAVADRLARALTLLRTRVEIGVEAQSRDLLQSMDRRARQQLRLQQTVEGLSAAAISYYVVGLVAHAINGIASFGVPIDPEFGTAIAIPFVIAGVWIGLRRIRRRIDLDRQPT